MVVKPETGNNVSVRDSMVVTNDGIFEVFGNESSPWTARRVKTLPFKPKIGIELPWSQVGLHMYAAKC